MFTSKNSISSSTENDPSIARKRLEDTSSNNGENAEGNIENEHNFISIADNVFMKSFSVARYIPPKKAKIVPEKQTELQKEFFAKAIVAMKKNEEKYNLLTRKDEEIEKNESKMMGQSDLYLFEENLMNKKKAAPDSLPVVVVKNNSLEKNENGKKQAPEFLTVQANQIQTSTYLAKNGKITKSFSKLGASCNHVRYKF